MSKHFGMPGERLVFNLTVQKVVIRETDFGPIADHTLSNEDGDIFFWQASTHTVWLTEGQQYTVKATVKTHDSENDIKRTILLRVVQVYEPPRVPRVAVGLSRHIQRR
jgi:hypothetical protein